MAVQATVLAHGTHGQLMEVVNQKIESNPSDANLWYQRGFLNLEHEDTSQALADLDKAESLAPGKLPTLLLKGQALELAGNLPDAKAALDAHVVRFPSHGRGYSSRARVLMKLEKPEEALADYRTALSKTPDAEPDLIQEAAVALSSHGHAKEAISILNAGLQRLGAIPSLLLKALEIEVDTGDFDSALTRVDLMEKSAPRPEPWMAKRAELLARVGRREESRAAWQALILHLQGLPNLERGSNSMSLLSEQARIALSAFDRPDRHVLPIKSGAVHEEEIQRANEQITATPADGQRWYQRSLLLLADGEFQEALLDCDEADRLSPNTLPTDYVRGQALAGIGQIEKGKIILNRFLSAHPEHVRGHAARARLLLSLHQTEGALENYRTAFRLSGNRPEIELVTEAVNALEANGAKEEARQMLNSQIKNTGGIHALLIRSLELETASGNYELAISRVDELAKTAPQPETWMAKRATLLGLAGHEDEARTAWTEILTRVDAMPNLQRGQPAMIALAQQARTALVAPVSPEPASPIPTSRP